MYKIEGEWVQVERIFKLLEKAVDFSDSFMADSAMEDAEVVVTKKWITRREIIGVEESTEFTKRTLGCRDVYLLSTISESDMAVVLNEAEVLKLISEVGASYIYGDGDRKAVRD